MEPARSLPLGKPITADHASLDILADHHSLAICYGLTTFLMSAPAGAAVTSYLCSVISYSRQHVTVKVSLRLFALTSTADDVAEQGQSATNLQSVDICAGYPGLAA